MGSVFEYLLFIELNLTTTTNELMLRQEFNVVVSASAQSSLNRRQYLHLLQKLHKATRSQW